VESSLHQYTKCGIFEKKKWPFRGQINQHFMRAFFVRKFVHSQTLNREKLLKRIFYKKFGRKMLMKLTPFHFYSFFRNFKLTRSLDLSHFFHSSIYTHCLYTKYTLCTTDLSRLTQSLWGHIGKLEQSLYWLSQLLI